MRAQSRTRLRRFAAAAAATAIIAAASATTYFCKHPHVAHAAAASVPEVPVVTVELRDVVEPKEFTDHLAASKTAEIRARVPGFIRSVHFSDGSTVAAGQLLFQLDARPYAAARDRFQAELDEA